MDTGYMARILLSVLIFAPGAILLAAFAFVGVLQLIERSGLFNWYAQRTTMAAGVAAVAAGSDANPAPGPVVSALDSALTEAEAARSGADKKVSNLN